MLSLGYLQLRLKELRIEGLKMLIAITSFLKLSLFEFTIAPTIISSSAETTEPFMYEVIEGTVADTWAEVTFQKRSKAITLLSEKEMQIQFAYGDVPYDEIFIVPVNKVWNLKIVADKVKIKNYHTGESGSCQIVIWYICSE